MGDHKLPSYQVIMDLVSHSLPGLMKEIVQKSFWVFQIGCNGVVVPCEDLHSRLRDMIEFPGDQVVELVESSDEGDECECKIVQLEEKQRD